jgi:hypothetical protein
MKGRLLAVAGTSVLLASGANAQGFPEHFDVMIPHAQVMERGRAVAGVFAGGDPVGAQFMALEMSVDGKPVKGAPYSAEATTESTQTLPDGNKISRKSTTQLYRDTEGRTRRDSTMSMIGPWSTDGQPATTSVIIDPVAKTQYILQHKTKTARKLPYMDGANFFVYDSKTSGGPGHAGTRVEKEFSFVRRDDVAVAGTPATGVVMVDRMNSNADKTESLGKKNIEGLVCEGTRTTHTIPAGEIGNERAIDIVSERWYSPELQTVVLTRHADPRMGETVYRLNRVQRSDPSRSLFEVPADYSTTEMPDPLRKIRTAKPHIDRL